MTKIVGHVINIKQLKTLGGQIDEIFCYNLILYIITCFRIL
jgi:hypothetical protein